MLIEASPASMLFSGIVAALVVGALWGTIVPTWLVSWAGYMLILAVLRYLHVLQFKKSDHDKRNFTSFKNWYLSGVVCAAIGWGVAGALVFAPQYVIYQNLLAFVLVGVTSASVTVHGPMITAMRYFIIVALTPIIVVHFLIGSQAHILMGVLICGYMLFLLRLGTVVHKSIITTLGFRYHNEELIAELTAAKQRADDINDKLKQEISGRSVTEAKLMEAVENAEEAAHAKSDFLATMSHEIRTPMNGVLGMTELLMNTSLTKKQFRFADTIRRSGEGLLAIINDILDFSKIEAGKLNIQHTVFDLRQLVEDSAAMFAEQAQSKHVELVLRFPPSEHAAYRGDPDRIRQILTNLLGNALKFTERGEVSLHVKSFETPDDLATLRFDVVDSGIGIQPDHQRHIFDSFQQADGSTTRKFGGTGLGLAICSKLVQMMQGEIGVESELGKGSTFWFTTQVSKMPADSISGQIKHTAELHGRRVLIVDNNETNREILEYQLTSWHMVIDSTNSATVALEKLREAAADGTPFAFAILDREMPGVGGVELAGKIKKDPALEQTLIVMLSSVNQMEETGQWFMAGIDTYVNKPVRQLELFDALSRSLQDKTPEQLSQLIKPSDAPGPAHNLGAHVLLVEDNPINQELARGMLEALGCTVVVAKNGREAVEAVTDAPLDAMQRSYDAILMDCQMPEMDGYEATAQLRHWQQQHPDDNRLPIIALTANALEGDRDKCLAAGMDDYLTKPFTLEQLATTLKRWLKPSVVVTAERTNSLNQTASVGGATGRREAAKLDAEALNNIRALQQQGSPDILAKIVHMFISNSPKHLEKMEEAATTGNADLLRSSAHSLKSSSANLGATEMSTLCGELEQMGRDNELENALSKVGVLEFEFEAVCEELTAMLASEAA